MEVKSSGRISFSSSIYFLISKGPGIQDDFSHEFHVKRTCDFHLSTYTGLEKNDFSPRDISPLHVYSVNFM
jgi:hypothetical protein